MTGHPDFGNDDVVPTPTEIRARLRAAVLATVQGDASGIDDAAAWLVAVSPRDLLRVDGIARRWSYDGATMGSTQQWTRRVLRSNRLAPSLASMHPDGFLREKAVDALAHLHDPLSDRMLALRVADHVEQVRERSVREVVSRTDLVAADQIAPVLQRFESRSRGAEARTIYLDELELRHGPEQLWAHLRESSDTDIRRVAFRHSVERKYLGVTDAVRHLERDRDQVVRRLVANLVADTAEPQVIRSALLHSRVAEARVLGLVKLGPADLSASDVRSLLGDSSVLVRFWARKRWTERGGNPMEACRLLVESGLTPTRRANAYLGLAEAGAEVQRDEVLELAQSPDLPLQKVGLRLLKDQVAPSDAELLLRLVAGEHSRIARMSSDVLASNRGIWKLSDLEPLKRAHDPELRRRAWLLHRSRRGWESVIADLQILEDPDPHLALLGRQPIAPMYSTPDERQRALIEELLRRVRLNRDLRLRIAHAAGLGDLVVELRQTSRSASVTPEVPTTAHAGADARPLPASRWQRLWGRRR